MSYPTTPSLPLELEPKQKLMQPAPRTGRTERQTQMKMSGLVPGVTWRYVIIFC